MPAGVVGEGGLTNRGASFPRSALADREAARSAWQESGEGMEGEAVGFGDGLAGEVALEAVHAAGEFGAELAGFGKPAFGNEVDVAVGDIRQGLGGGAAVGTGHIGDTIMDHAFLDIRRMVVSGGPGGFGAAALVHRDVHEHTPSGHELEHFAGDEFGCFGSGDEHGADDEVGLGEQGGKTGFAGIEGVGGLHGDVEVAHTLHVHFEDGDVGAEAGGHAGGVDAGGAAAEDYDFSWQDSRHSAEQHAASALVAGQVVGTDKNGH